MPDRTDIKTEVNRGLAWIGLASSLVWALDIIANIIILAIWVSPTDYGVAALALSVFPVLDLATDMGLSAAIIQRDDHTSAKISTVFWLNLAMSLVLFGLLAGLLGPALASFHGHPIVGLMLTAYGARLLWMNVYLVPVALLRRELRFKELSGIRTFANVCEFAGKVGTAAAGFGIWCFVVGPLARAVGYGLGAQYCRPWRPRLVLQLRETLDWLTFGLKTTASQLLYFGYTNVDYQVVGYYFGAEANGYYRLATDLVLQPCYMISFVVIQIAFPAYARLKNLRELLVDQFISFTRLNLVIMLTFLGIVMVSAEDLIGAFWGDEWVPAATAARILCVVGVLRALSFIIPPLLDGIGRPGLTLIHSIVAAVVVPASFVVGAELLGDDYDYLSVAIAWCVGYPVAFGVLAYLGLRMLKLSTLEYLRRTLGVPACAALAIAASTAVTLAAQPLPRGLRLALAATTLVGVFLVALARWQGISPASIRAALKDKPQPGDSGAIEEAAASSGNDSLPA